MTCVVLHFGLVSATHNRIESPPGLLHLAESLLSILLFKSAVHMLRHIEVQIEPLPKNQHPNLLFTAQHMYNWCSSESE